MTDKKPESVRILLNPDSLKRKKPWEISLYILLDEFYKYLKSLPLLDYRLSGLAVLTSSMVYKLKVQHLFYEERRKVIKKDVEIVNPIDALSMPFRMDVQMSDIEDLVLAFEALLSDIEKKEEEGPIIKPLSELPTFDQEALLNMLKPLEEEVMYKLEIEPELKFSELIMSKTPLEVVRYFILLLFLAQEGKVVLVQKEEDILIVGVER
jgi:segregation and condensation protein A